MTATTKARRTILESWDKITDELDKQMNEDIRKASYDMHKDEASVRNYWLEVHATVNIAMGRALEWCNNEIEKGR